MSVVYNAYSATDSEIELIDFDNLDGMLPVVRLAWANQEASTRLTNSMYSATGGIQVTGNYDHSKSQLWEVDIRDGRDALLMSRIFARPDTVDPHRVPSAYSYALEIMASADGDASLIDLLIPSEWFPETLTTTIVRGRERDVIISPITGEEIIVDGRTFKNIFKALRLRKVIYKCLSNMITYDYKVDEFCVISFVKLQDRWGKKRRKNIITQLGNDTMPTYPTLTKILNDNEISLNVIAVDRTVLQEQPHMRFNLDICIHSQHMYVINSHTPKRKLYTLENDEYDKLKNALQKKSDLLEYSRYHFVYGREKYKLPPNTLFQELNDRYQLTSSYSKFNVDFYRKCNIRAIRYYDENLTSGTKIDMNRCYPEIMNNPRHKFFVTTGLEAVSKYKKGNGIKDECFYRVDISKKKYLTALHRRCASKLSTVFFCGATKVWMSGYEVNRYGISPKRISFAILSTRSKCPKAKLTPTQREKTTTELTSSLYQYRTQRKYTTVTTPYTTYLSKPAFAPPHPNLDSQLDLVMATTEESIKYAENKKWHHDIVKYSGYLARWSTYISKNYDIDDEDERIAFKNKYGNRCSDRNGINILLSYPKHKCGLFAYLNIIAICRAKLVRLYNCVLDKYPKANVRRIYSDSIEFDVVFKIKNDKLNPNGDFPYLGSDILVHIEENRSIGRHGIPRDIKFNHKRYKRKKLRMHTDIMPLLVDGMSVFINAFAGVGKTYLALNTIIPFAITHSLKYLLTSSTVENSVEWQTSITTVDPNGICEGKAINHYIRKKLGIRQIIKYFNDLDYVLIDECSQLTLHTLHILEIIKDECGCKFIFLGDGHQTLNCEHICYLNYGIFRRLCDYNILTIAPHKNMRLTFDAYYALKKFIDIATTKGKRDSQKYISTKYHTKDNVHKHIAHTHEKRRELVRKGYYCHTIHSTQGKTIDEEFVVNYVPSSTYREIYTGLSRGHGFDSVFLHPRSYKIAKYHRGGDQ